MSLLNPEFAPLIIFVLRVLNNAIGTLRIILMNEDRRAWGFAAASLESLLFAYTAGLVITDLNNVPNLAAYVLGYAVGGYVGMAIENRYLNIYDTANIIASTEKAHQIALALRGEGYGVTESKGEGVTGEVMMLRVVAHHREIHRIVQLAREIKPDAFITVEEARMIRGGWLHAQRQRHS